MTAAEAMGAQLPKDRTIDGRSWFPLFKDPTATIHDAIYFEWADQYAVRSGKWKYVENGLIDMEISRKNRATGENKTFLADVAADPGEKKNLRSQFPDIAAKLVKTGGPVIETASVNPPMAGPAFDPNKIPQFIILIPQAWRLGLTSTRSRCNTN